jgi:hypothetical protein
MLLYVACTRESACTRGDQRMHQVFLCKSSLKAEPKLQHTHIKWTSFKINVQFLGGLQVDILLHTQKNARQGAQLACCATTHNLNNCLLDQEWTHKGYTNISGLPTTSQCNLLQHAKVHKKCTTNSHTAAILLVVSSIFLG